MYYEPETTTLIEYSFGAQLTTNKNCINLNAKKVHDGKDKKLGCHASSLIMKCMGIMTSSLTSSVKACATDK